MTEVVEIRLARSVRSRRSLLICGSFQGEPAPTQGASDPLREAIERATRRDGFEGRSGQRSEAEIGPGDTGLVVVHGLGPRGEFSGESVRKWARRVGVELRSRARTSAHLLAPEHPVVSGPDGAEPLLRHLALTDYRFLEFKDAATQPPRIASLTLVVPEADRGAYRKARPVALAVARGAITTRDLANTPPNVATPAWMAQQARRLAAEFDMKVTVLGPRELARRKMGGILAVGGGSANPPRLVRLEWGSGRRSVSLVGKGVTFDTGGISIKPAAAMDEMKYDKSGACTVLGIARATAQLDLPLRFRAYLPLAENMPDGSAYRPGDIVTCHNGKTVEILNTDAEGRMILADALSWAASEKPDFLVDYATLTGACVVALGQSGAGLFSPDDELVEGLLEGATVADEYLWRLPLWPEFGRAMKGTHADLRNAGGRWGGASTAAAFLSSFVDGAGQWAHVDLAGPAYVGAAGGSRKGATGYGVALSVHWLRSLPR